MRGELGREVGEEGEDWGRRGVTAKCLGASFGGD